MSHLLKVLEDEVQLIALSWLAIVYIIRIFWLFRFSHKKEQTFAAGRPGRGAAYSLMNIAMPWAMESTRRNPGFYLQFVIFHLGVLLAIASTFIIPYGPELFENSGVVRLFQGLIGAALIVGLWRLYRRLRSPRLRLVSSADDYFSLSLMIVYFAAAVLALPNTPEASEIPLILFFGLTAFFLFYVPFSKIGHYLYYPLTRGLLGRSLGHRGVLFKETPRSQKRDSSP